MMTNGSHLGSPRPCLIYFPYKNTGMGGFEDVVMLSFRTGKPLRSVLRRSRTHGKRYYRVLPSKYLVYSVWRSNSGNLYGRVSTIRVYDECRVDVEKAWTIVHISKQEMQIEDLPDDVKKILISNQDQLPLFRAVFMLGIQDGDPEGE